MGNERLGIIMLRLAAICGWTAFVIWRMVLEWTIYALAGWGIFWLAVTLIIVFVKFDDDTGNSSD